MPIFEMDDGRARLLQPMQPLASSFVGELRGLLTEHLAVVLGEPLFPVRSRAALPDQSDAPELLALDAAGAPVVVEAVQVVDDAALVTALRHAGSAARLTATDLARAYHADPTRFGVDYAAFREQVVFQPSAADRPHVRLVVLCAEVAAETADALAALCAADARVRVLQVGVMRGSDDRRLLDVSPLAHHEGARRPVEPTALRLVRMAAGVADDRHAAPVPTPHETPVPAVPAPPVVPARVGSHRAPSDPTSIELSFPEPARVAAPGLGDPVVADRSFAAAAETPAFAPPSTRSRPAPPVYPPVEPPTPRLEAPPEMLPVPGGSSTLRSAPMQVAEVRPGAPERASAAPNRPEPGPVQAGPGSDRQWPLSELTTLAKRRQAVTLLVWLRERRGQRFEAMLRADGLIQLPDGSVFADPDLAAARAAGTEGVVDGWRSWRLGEGGPSLAEAAGR